MSASTLRQVLAATGYLPDGQPVTGLQLGQNLQHLRRGRDFSPDAIWRNPSSLTVYFKFEQTTPADELVGQWRREVWNEGFAPLLWVVSPERIDLYNGFGAPIKEGDAQKHRIYSFKNIEASLVELDALAGRLAIETGQFWAQATAIDRKTSVDQRLLSDLALLESDLVSANLARSAAQALMGRVIFTQYLIDREIVSTTLLKKLCGHTALPSILRDLTATEQLFGWLSHTFNGDMFPPSSVKYTPAINHLERVADFLDAVDPESGQQSFFPYRFDVIPVELISSIYEQFAHADLRVGAPHLIEAVGNGVHYTRLSVVSLVLDEIMDGLTGNESVLDLTCGSGVFLVEALRRLVHLRARHQPRTRALIRSTLHEQVYGVDISEAAVRVAAFSLYLAALELDPDPHQPPHSLKFEPLIGKTLLIGDARTVEQSEIGEAVLTTHAGLKQFDLIVGNPPWNFKGRAGTEARRKTRMAGVPAQPRGEGLDFVLRAVEFSHGKTRFGVILSAMPFFSRSRTGMAAVQHVMRLLAPITLVNLSNLCGWLFATATMPAVVLFARHRQQPADQVTVVQIPWTASGARTHSFEVSSSNIIRLRLADIETQPLTLKAAAVGKRRDLVLLATLLGNHVNAGDQLDQTFGTKFSDGMKFGRVENQVKSSIDLRGLQVLHAKDLLHPFSVNHDLTIFSHSKVEAPRTIDTFRAPLLIVKEMVGNGGRLLVATIDRDIVYTDSFFAASLPDSQAARLLAAILASSLGAWFFLMTSAEFGIYKRKLLIRDVDALPIPNLKKSLDSAAGKRLLQIEALHQNRRLTEDDWRVLDEAVFDLYDLDAADRVVVRDGLFRASWQWQAGRESSVASANARTDIAQYAEAFMGVTGGWLSARNQRHMRAEIFDLPIGSALRVVRFVLEDGPGNARIDVVTPEGELNDVLAQIGKRLKVKLATALSGERELRIHGRNEVVIIKPSARRYWMGIAALEDADAVVAESFTRGDA